MAHDILEGMNEASLKGPTTQITLEELKGFAVVYPVILRQAVVGDVACDTTPIYWVENLMYLAPSQETAVSWCQRNLDIEKKDKARWWFVIQQEAIDGEFSGIKGTVCVVDWDGRVLDHDPGLDIGDQMNPRKVVVVDSKGAVYTGPLQVNDQAPGLYIHNEEAHAIKDKIKTVLEDFDSHPPIDDKGQPKEELCDALGTLYNFGRFIHDKILKVDKPANEEEKTELKIADVCHDDCTCTAQQPVETGA